MNCKPGDLAIVVRGEVFLGTICEVVRLLGYFKPGEIFIYKGYEQRSGLGGPVWEVKSRDLDLASDLALMPIDPKLKEEIETEEYEAQI